MARVVLTRAVIAEVEYCLSFGTWRCKKELEKYLEVLKKYE